MELALKEAQKAYKLGEVPVGCIIVKDNIVIAKGYNKKETNKDVTAHAEIIALKRASAKLDNWRVDDLDIYITLEPCPMCMAALMQAHIKNVYFGAYDKVMGACGSKISLQSLNFQTPRINVYGGILEDKCLEILRRFFKELRNQ